MKFSAFFLCIFLIFLVGQSDISAQSFSNSDKTAADRIDKIVSAYFNKDGLGGVILVTNHGKVIYEKAVGKANVELNVPLSNEDVFRIGSLTKQFTALAILQLMEKGVLSLDDDITEFIPDYPTHGNHIAVRNLLSHTSGIKDYTEIDSLSPDMRRRNNSPADLISFFKNQPMDFKPGDEFEYSNSNYILLGYIIEKLSGKSYAQYINDNIFIPLGMNHSFFDTPEKIIPNRIPGYVDKGDKAVNADYLNPSYAYSAGALMMPISDIFKWHKGLYQYSILKKENLEKAFSPFTLNNGQKTNYGFGWELDTLDGSVTIGHSGSINGFSAYEVYLPKEDIYVACFSNCVNKNTRGPAILAASVVANKSTVKDISLTEKQMAMYKGIYKFQPDKPSVTRIFEKRVHYFYRTAGLRSPGKCILQPQRVFIVMNCFQTITFSLLIAWGM